MANLTPKQKHVLDALVRYKERAGTAPTLDELAELCRVSKSTIRQYLRALETKGFIRRSRYEHRSIELLEGPGTQRLPMVGRVAAGTPILAVENIESYMEKSELLRNADFLLKVEGDSMRDAGILDGDLVAVRKQPRVENGEIGVALVGDEATVKRIYFLKKGIRLVPENPDYETIEPAGDSEEIHVVGRVVAVVRKL